MSMLLAILVPVAAAPFVLAAGRRVGPLLALVAAVVSAVAALAAAVAAPFVGFAWGPGLDLALNAGGLARPFGLAVPLIGTAILGYAAATTAAGFARNRLLALLLAFLGAMQLLVYAEDLLTLLFAWEIISGLSWVLIGHQWTDATRPARALHAFLTTRVGDLGLYAAVGLTYAQTGRLDYPALQELEGATAHAVAAGLLLAAAAKSAQLPFSPWLASAMAGPTPVSALLHSATLVAAGAYALARVMPELAAVGWLGPAVMAVGLTTALGMGVVAALERDLKRVLAASTCAQYGLIFTAVGAGSVAAAGGHLLTHAAFKALLFLTAGIALTAAGTGDLGRLRLGRALPLVAGAAALGAASLAAVPPLPGAWSKEAIVAASFEASAAAGVAALAASTLTAFYAARWWLLTFGRTDADTDAADAAGSRPGRTVLAGPALLVVLLLTLLLGWLQPVQRAFAEILGAELPEVQIAEVVVSLVLLVVGAGAAVLLDRRGALLTLGLPGWVQGAATSWLGLAATARVLLADPVLRVARVYADVDDRVVDAGVRLTGRVGDLFGRVLAWWGERAVDGVVLRTASGTQWAARAASALQTGLTHHYFVLVGVGVVLTVAVAALGNY